MRVRFSPTAPQHRWRQKQIDNIRCTVCGDPLPDNDLRTTCRGCAHRHNIYNIYMRHFMKDFK